MKYLIETANTYWVKPWISLFDNLGNNNLGLGAVPSKVESGYSEKNATFILCPRQL